ncbi:MAG: acyltransferase [Rikenellaceae bacterium]
MKQIERVEFVDLAKGICIILVVLSHCDVDIAVPFEHLRIPLYFVLSGLFFKTYGGIRELVVKKVNRLLVPFVSFYGASIALILFASWALMWFKGVSIFIGEERFTSGLFTPGFLFTNAPLWFLLSLFWCNLIFAIIKIYIKRRSVQLLFIGLIAVVGCYFGYYQLFLPLYIASSLTALPFFCLGYYLQKTSILRASRHDRLFLAISIVLILTTSVIAKYNTLYFQFGLNKVHGNALLIYLLSSVSVVALLGVCKAIGRLPTISYIGKYSIVILCTHLIFAKAIFLFSSAVNWECSNLLVFIIVMIISTISIPLFIKYAPYIVAQKDLFK